MNLLGKGTSPEFWREVREKDFFKFYRDELSKLWEENCIKPIEALRYSEYRMFKESGNRSVYEGSFFHRRRALDTAALLSLIYPDEEKYIVKLMDVIYAICDECTWAIPATQLTLDDNPYNNRHLDLFACETGFALAEIDTLLGNRLEPLIRDRIRVEFKRRVLDSMDEQIWHWEHNRGNWTAVCNCSVACAIMLLYPECYEKYKTRFAENMQTYLNFFEDDGVCTEGIGYWYYGFGFFTVYADMIRTFTNGETDLFACPKVKKLATFAQKMFLSGRSTVSFGDTNPNAKYQLGLMHYLKDEYREDISFPAISHSYNYDNCGRFCLHLRSATWFNEKYLSADSMAKEDTFFGEKAEWFVYKNENYGFAAKGGNNEEPHNHNDVGTFIIAKDGKSALVDTGAGQYSKQYFEDETRYDFIHCSSRGHSVPMIGGVHQHYGKDKKAKNTKYENGVFSADIAEAYPIPELKSLVRAFSFTNDAVILTDTYDYEGDGDIVERFISFVQPVKKADGEVQIDNITLKFDPTVGEVSFGSEPGRGTQVIYFTDVKLKKGTKAFTAEFKA